jgi:transmembrane sensor
MNARPMNPLKNAGSQAVEHEASLWAARLETGPLTAAEEAELSQWMERDPEHRWVLSRYRELCAQLAEEVPILADADDVAQVVSRAAALHRWKRAAWPLLGIAAAAAVATAAWWMWPKAVETRESERRAIALGDGSRVELNARTDIAISLGRRERHVRFDHGEAFFEVAHDPGRPFFVDTPKGSVRVTGTVFDVRETSSGDFEVTLLEGSIQVRPNAPAPDPAAPVPLAANERAVLNGGAPSVVALTPDEAQDVAAWRVGQAAFQDAPLAEALARFAPYHPGRISVSPGAASLHVGGRYDLSDLDGFLAAIERALPVTVLRDDADGSVRVVPRR